MTRLIAPTHMTKEKFLAQGGDEVEFETLTSFYIGEGKALVCLLNYGHYTEAEIVDNEEQWNALKAVDHRPKTWYVVDEDKLEAVTTDA